MDLLVAWRHGDAKAGNALFERRSRDVVVDHEMTSCADLGISPSAALGRDDDHKLLLLALRQLPIEMQVALELYYFERIRRPERAQVLDIPGGDRPQSLASGRRVVARATADVASNRRAWSRLTMSNLDDWVDGLKGRREALRVIDPEADDEPAGASSTGKESAKRR